MIQRFLQFFGASAGGLALDYFFYTLLCESGMQPGYANLISASTGVTFVFFVSAHRIFDSSDHFLGRLFVYYALYQACAITGASWLVDTMTEVFDGKYILGKTVVLPLTFAINFVVMSWMFSERRREALSAPR